jgi:hypothetical protein
MSVGNNANILVVTTSGISVTGNATVSNVNASGLITATGNIQGGNLITTGILSVSGNANIANIGTGGFITAEGTVRGGALSTGGSLGVTGNANIGNIGTAGLITATGNIGGGNLTTGGILSATGGGNSYIAGSLGIKTTSPTAPLHVKQNGSLVNLEGTDHAYIQFYPRGTANRTSWIGVGSAGSNNFTVRNDDNGRLLLESGNSNVSVFANGNITTTVAGVSNILVVTNTGANINGYLSVSGNTITNAITTGSNITTGTITGNWTLTTGSRLQATYADLAEYYEADADYEPGTVLEFGGDQEVTLAQKETTRVAGVVSTNPAYAMNSNCQGIAVAIALQGRVPTKVRGAIRKGDMMVSAGDGYARPWNNPQMGTVIGKALENFDGIEGVIEVAVGRL